MPNNGTDTPSRLREDSEKIRYFLETRNLHTPNDPYNLFNNPYAVFQNAADPDGIHSPYLDNRRVAQTVNALTGIIKPFSSFDLTNTVLYRAIGPKTPIAQIGTVMLAKQFTQTVQSNASRAV